MPGGDVLKLDNTVFIRFGGSGPVIILHGQGESRAAQCVGLLIHLGELQRPHITSDLGDLKVHGQHGIFT